jgi:hypothetical protein
MSLVARLNRSISTSFELVRQGEGKEIATMVGTRIWGAQLATGLDRDMTVPFPAPEARFPISVRLIRPDDVPKLLNVAAPGLSASERNNMITRLGMLDAGFSSCFVAVTANDEPCYMQWLISPEENALLATEFDNLFPQLGPREMLLEGAYTPEAFRGQRIMPAAMALLAEHAASLGASRVITFVGIPNIPSIKGCERAGFAPYTTRETVYRLGSRQISFHPVK